MKQVIKIRLITAFALSVMLPLALKPIFAADQTVNLRLSAGNSWQARNDVQIPNTDLGTRFFA